MLADTLAAFVTVDAIREAALVLTEYAVDARYPGADADADEAAPGGFLRGIRAAVGGDGRPLTRTPCDPKPRPVY